MLEADNLEAAIAQEAFYQDERIAQVWDGERILGTLVAETLKLSVLVAWDVYLLYLPGAVWKGGLLPTPAFWMHQLNERRDLHLVPEKLMDEVRKAVETSSK
jgi:hypothetical protein